MALSLSSRRLDPRISLAILILLNAAAFAPHAVYLYSLLVALVAGVMVWCGRFYTAFKWLAVYAVLTVLDALITTFPMAVLSSFAVIIVMTRCVFVIAMFASNMIATTRVGELSCVLQRMHVPRHGAIALCVMLRFFPTMSTEFRSVREALKVRGMRLNARSVLTHPVLVMERLLVPVMSRLSIVADELSNAAIVRGMDSDRPHSSIYELRLKAVDWLFLACFLAVAISLLLMRLGVI